MTKKGTLKRDGSGKGKRGNKGRGGCKTPRSKGRGRKWKRYVIRKHAKVNVVRRHIKKCIGHMEKSI